MSPLLTRTLLISEALRTTLRQNTFPRRDVVRIKSLMTGKGFEVETLLWPALAINISNAPLSCCFFSSLPLLPKRPHTHPISRTIRYSALGSGQLEELRPILFG